MLPIFSRAVLTGSTLAAALLLAGSAAAQSARPVSITPMPVANAAPVVASAKPAAEGTFQLVRLTQKRTIAITSEALAEIEQRRKEDVEVSWAVSPYAIIRILPRRVISAKGFVPMAPVVDKQ